MLEDFYTTLNNLWTTNFGKPLDGVWKTFGRVLEIVWTTVEKQLDYFWNLFGPYLENCWTIIGAQLIKPEHAKQMCETATG